MLARSAEEIPDGEGWRYEPKWDGFRCIVERGDGGAGEVGIASRDARPLGRYFPELVELLEASPAETYLFDAEIVLVARGRMEFDTLQQRLHPAASRVRTLAAATPATLVAFDLLEVGGRDLRPLEFDERRSQLEALVTRLGGSPPPAGPEGLREGPELFLTPQTADPQIAQVWFADEAVFGQDGIVAKRADQRYLEGERAMVKVKHHRTLDCVVGGYRVEKNGNGVASLLLGLYDAAGVLHYVGHTSSFPAAQRRAMREELAPLEGGASFGQGRAPGGPSRWSGGRETEWVPLDPVLVCEVRIDRMQGDRFRHASRLLRWRDDRDPHSCTFDQLDAAG
jgi:ATP-dependent DNA ligase